MHRAEGREVHILYEKDCLTSVTESDDTHVHTTTTNTSMILNEHMSMSILVLPIPAINEDITSESNQRSITHGDKAHTAILLYFSYSILFSYSNNKAVWRVGKKKETLGDTSVMMSLLFVERRRLFEL